ncbi:MAG: hypothetical protein JRG96_12925 [Deltaproteobacteria bacterium]|nr:hypothetical protein [Deltaproteobacteria bacterium]MBW2419709.1 hypothetical protein [Deltaproteobacteria bacterium]
MRRVGDDLRSRVSWLGLWLVLALLLVLRVAAASRESVNWDEFNLLNHAAWTAESGVLHSAGRPGLVVLLLGPLAGGCSDEIAVVRAARVLWIGFTGLALAGLAVLLAQLRPNSPRRWSDALLGVSLLALVPAFTLWSLQVRTDQVALVGGLWGGVALIASRRRPGLAVAAGLLFGLGFLATQKLVYVGGLVSLLALGEMWLARDLRPHREGMRVMLCLAAMGMVVVGFHAMVAQYWMPEGAAVGAADRLTKGAAASFKQGMGVFEYYRTTIGYSQYIEMLPSLLPHLLLGVLLTVTSLRALWKGGVVRPRLVLAWSVLLLGLAVGAFHAGAFAYFWMTLGLFPAVALVLARDAMEESLAFLPRPALTAGVAAFWLLLALPGVAAMGSLLEDSQRVQRESLAFTHRNFERGDSGFHPEGGLFCRDAPHRFPNYFSRAINASFGPASACESCTWDFINRFEGEQVKFILESYRLHQFPPLVRSFWLDHYVPYRGSVLVAGRRFGGADAAQSVEFSLVVDGEYLWLPAAREAEIAIDGVSLARGGRIRLDRGLHTAHFAGPAPEGLLVLAMSEAPGPGLEPFYRQY